MLYSQISGFGVFRSRLYFKIRVKNSFLFHSDTNFNGGNKTPTPSPKGFFGQSSSFPIGRAYSPEKGLVYLFSTIRGVFTNLKREKIISVEEWDTGHGIL